MKWLARLCGVTLLVFAAVSIFFFVGLALDFSKPLQGRLVGIAVGTVIGAVLAVLGVLLVLGPEASRGNQLWSPTGWRALGGAFLAIAALLASSAAPTGWGADELQAIGCCAIFGVYCFSVAKRAQGKLDGS